jgi:hypothetical protein
MEPINFDNRPARTEPEKVHLFTLNETDYFIPSEIGPGVGLRYLYNLKLHGEQYATADLLFAVLGEKTMEALSNSDQITPDDMKVILGVVRDRAVGALEGN